MNKIVINDYRIAFRCREGDGSLLEFEDNWTDNGDLCVTIYDGMADDYCHCVISEEDAIDLIHSLTKRIRERNDKAKRSKSDNSTL
jgi:hypothetical protein